MAILVYVLGRSGTGKSYSMRNFPKDKLAILNVQGKVLPFRNSGEIEQSSTDNPEKLVNQIEKYAKKYKSIVVDDFQYLMANEFMRRAYESGWDKFTEIGRHAWDVPDSVRNLPQDVIVYIMCHTDTDSEGIERLKTIGKLLDEKIFLEGMSTIVLKTHVSDGKYYFVTQNSGKDTVKSPADMFPTYAIDNDLWYVDQKIREYYGLESTMTADELADADEMVAHEEVQKGEKKRRGRKAEEAEASPKEEKTTTRKRSESDDVKETERRNTEAVVEANLSDDGEPVPFDEAEIPEIEEMPRRKRRKPKDIEEPEEQEEPELFPMPEESESTEPEAETGTRRRRRRRV